MLAGRAISAPFRARRHRSATVNHGHSRPFDLGALYYRCAAARMVRMGSPARFRRRLLRWWFRLVGSDGWRRGEVRLWPRTTVQASGQSIGVLPSLPAASLPSFLELDHTVPRSQPHPALHPNRTIHGAHGSPPDRVELLQRVGRTCHDRIILTSNPTRKTSLEDQSPGARILPRILMQPWSLRASQGRGACEQGVASPRT